MVSKVQKMEEWNRGNDPGPYRLEIHPTNRCNLKCKMCGTRASWKKEDEDISKLMEENKERELSDEKLLKLVDEASSMDVQRILLTGGGEPFVRKSITLEMMEKIKGGNIFGNLNTNGTLLNEDEIRKIVDMGWDLIMFSIDAPFAEVHDFLRGVPGTFENASKNLIRFKRMKKEENLENPEIAFNTVLTERNYRYIPELIEFANEIDCNDLTLIPLIDPQKHKYLSIDNQENLMDVLNRSLDIAARRSLHTNISDIKNKFSSDSGGNYTGNSKEKQVENNFGNIPCFEPFLNMVIKMDGKVTPCCMIENGPNIKGKTLEEIWTGDYYKNLRRKFKEHKIPDSCSECILSKESRNENIRRKLGEMED